MSNPAAGQQIGVSGSARKYGVPSLAIQWVGNDGATDRVLQIFSDVNKTPGATIQTGVDNANEIVTFNRSQRKRQVKFTAVATSDSIADAEAIATDLPLPMDIVSIGHMAAGAFAVAGGGVVDAQIETAYAICDDAQARWSPEGALMVDFTVTVHLNPDGTIRQFVAIS